MPILIALVLAGAAVLVLALFSGDADEKMQVSGGTISRVNTVVTTGKKVEAQEDYVLVAESDTYRLYYYEPRFSIKLENKETGVVLESTVSDEMDDGKNNESWTGYMKSGIVIYAIIGTTNTYQVDMNTCKNTINTWYTENGIYAEIYFDEYKFGLSVEIALEGDELVVRVPESSIIEEKNGTYISNVSLFPFLGYSYLGEKDGYMLVPDGNGALIYLDDKEGRYATGFSRMIYGADSGFASQDTSSYLWGWYETVTDPNSVMAPIFGMAHTEDGIAYLAVVESGDERCSVECQPNGIMVDYNRCFARFLLRDVYVQPLNNSNSGTVQTVENDRLHSDLQVRYCLLSGEDANYSGMANAYRDYLLAQKIVAKQDTAYRTRIDFLGTEREKFLMGTTAVTMTTVDDMEKMYDQLRTSGVENVLTLYKGWQKGGLYDLPISTCKADSHIGGTGALTDMILRQAEQGYNVYLYDDALLVNDTTTMSTFDVMKMVNKRTFKIEKFANVYELFYYLLPEKLQNNLASLVEDCLSKGVDTLALAGVSSDLFSYSSKGAYYSRTDTMECFEDAVAAADEDCRLLLETPNAYLWKYTEAFLDMPLGSSEYLYVDQEIPFLSMVLKGILPMYSEYVNFEANKTENFLQMVEAGVYPSFYLAWEDSSKLIYTNSDNLYSLDYNSYGDTIREYDAALRELAEKTGDAFILRHETLQTGLVRVSYDNGVTVYVNYTESDLSADGLTVPALSYKVGE